MHVLGDRVLFFDPELNPELSYAADLGTAGTAAPGIPGYRYEGNGLHSLDALQQAGEGALAGKTLLDVSNALEPGWVPTKMGGPGAPDDDLDPAAEHQHDPVDAAGVLPGGVGCVC